MGWRLVESGVDCGGAVERQTSTLCEQMRQSTLWAALLHVRGEMVFNVQSAFASTSCIYAVWTLPTGRENTNEIASI